MTQKKRGMIISPISLADLLLNTPSAIIGANALGKIIYVTSSTEDLLGWTVEDLVGKDLTFVMPERLRSLHTKGFRKWVNTGILETAGRPLRAHALHKDGHEIPVEITLGAYKSSEGDLRVVGMIRNIRDYIELEEEGERLKKELMFARSLTVSMGEGLIATDVNGKITLVNMAAEKMLGWTQEEIIGKNGHDIVHHSHNDDSDTMPKDQCPILKVVATNEPIQFDDDYFKRKDGEKINVSVVAAPIIVNDVDTGIVTVFKDITEQKRQREELEASEMRYKELVQLNPDAILVHSEGKIIFANRACLELMKAKSFDQIKDTPILDFIAPEFHEFVISRIGTKPTIGEKLELAQEKGIDLEGNKIDIEVATMPVMFDGKPSILTVIRDISDRALKLFLGAIIENTQAIIIGKDLNGYVLYWSPAAERAYGWTADEMVNKRDVATIVPEDKMDEYRGILESIRAEKPVKKLSTTRITKYGKLRKVTISVSPIYSSNHTLIGSSSIGIDEGLGDEN